ncbi:phosphoserine phosphatase [Alcanivorax sp. P2S70]|jgi:HAD superfamily hydrolase (TIGR01490 family)|uniref:Histidinol-phosphatase n=1 Tax=Alcanivorax profundi TaxID=2338368 RepID=A0A418XUS1_9GAMM|nr:MULTISPECIES: HAD family hydrolase [Alcanivorax]ERP91759.1 phosphoserine phosphatase [Alcanivorax sp. P2S70]RJG16453.1 HAD-IB family hydrolase [Alcanivorax profundi]
MTLAIFDLDNTLIGCDSDHLWGDWLVEKGIVDAEHYKETNDQFYVDYQNGRLDILAYLRFSLKVLADNDMAQLHFWREQFLAEKLDEMWLPKAAELVEKHRQQGHTLMIITATNDFVTAPLADRLGIDHLIATVAERRKERFTGDIDGTPSYREGKVSRLQAWLDDHGETLDGSYFYSDSHNDLPLLQQVDNPVAVDPDATLEREARERGWPVISLR